MARQDYGPDNPVALHDYRTLSKESGPDAIFKVARVGERYEIVDSKGRVVVLRGVNVGTSGFMAIEQGDGDAFDQLKAWGVNAIRLLLPWEAIEPSPREINRDTLSYIRWVVDQADRRGMVVVIAAYQDRISRCFGGIGAPLWAHRSNLISDRAIESACRDFKLTGIAAFPRMMRWWADFYDASWSLDDVALQDHIIWAFMHLASVFRGHPGVLGYGTLTRPTCYNDFFTRWLYPGSRDCHDALSNHYKQFARGIRAVDSDALIFIEPPTDTSSNDWDTIERPDIEGVVWSVNAAPAEAREFNRDNCRLYEQLSAAEDFARTRFSTPLVLADFSVCADEVDADRHLAHLMLDIEDMMASVFISDYAKSPDPGLYPDMLKCDTNLIVAKDSPMAGLPRCFTTSFIRPYPQRIAGIPVKWGFDRSFENPPDKHHDSSPVNNSDVFTLVFRQGSASGATYVYVPRVIVFGEDPKTEVPEYIVKVSDGEWYWSSWDPNVLVWVTNPEQSEHRLEITPWGGGRAAGKGLIPCN